MTIVPVVSASEMFNACEAVFDVADIIVMSAAVADYTPVKRAEEKIKKSDDRFNLELTKTTDILKTLGARKKPGQVLVGFALETVNEKQYAREKLEKKNADIIVLNSLNDAGAGFGTDTNKVTIFQKDKPETEWPVKSKDAVAHDLVDLLIKTYYV